MANTTLRRLLANNESSKCTDVKIVDTAPCYKTANRESTPRWGGPAKISDIDESGVTVKCQYQTFKVARYCRRKKAEEKDAEEAEWGPMAS